MGGKRGFIGGRIPDELRQELDGIHAKYGTNDSGILEPLLRSWVAHVRRQDAVRWPIEIRELGGEPDAPLALAAEDAAGPAAGTGADLVRDLTAALRRAEALQAQEAARRRASSARGR